MSSTSEFLKNYELVEPTIRALYDSKLRLAILDALKDGPMRLADLRRAVNANAPNTSSKAKELENMGLIERIEGDFQLTPFGDATINRIQDNIDFHVTYEKFKDYWKSHEITGVPDFLVARLGELKNCHLLLNDPTNVQAPDEEFYKLMKKSKKFGWAIAPVMDPTWIKIIIERPKRTLDIRLIFTETVLKGFNKNLSKDEKEAFKSIRGMHVMRLDKDPKFLFAVSDAFFDINFRFKGFETYYMDADFMSFEERAIRWGLDLFRYYEKQAKPVNLSDYL